MSVLSFMLFNQIDWEKTFGENKNKVTNEINSMTDTVQKVSDNIQKSKDLTNTKK